MTPRATVRLQLTRDFGFDAARERIDYYAALGISHYYLSPVFRARAGSTHGYDTMDFAHVSDELGGPAGLERLAHALHDRAMGIILDIVPNHMGVAGNDNAWWNDVLARGANSAHADYFDIDWEPADAQLRGKVLLPVLDGDIDAVLERGQLGVVRAGSGDGLALAYYAARWPVAADSITDDPGALDADALVALDARHGADRERLRDLIARQHYRLDDWRRAGTRINWRRFFDISELAALRMEDERVFADVHRTTFDLFEAGIIDGVRVDHVDGLADPLDYCRRLRAALEARAGARPAARRDEPAYIVVEKVFAAHEPQRDWGVAGTTGYDFMDQASAVLHNPAGQPALDVLWRDVSGRPWEFRAAVAEARREVLEASFSADLGRVTRAFHALARAASQTQALSHAAIERALTELVVAFPVYRCYGMPGALPPEDAAILAAALERANRQLQPGDYEALDFVARSLRDVADGGAVDAAGPSLSPIQREAAVRFQQLTAAIAARAIEDTIFYREARLLSRNEVGSDPNVFSIGAEEFHSGCATRAHRFPHGLLATATHDHKRGEDVRARLAVLSDAADGWVQAVTRWRETNAPLRGMAGMTPAPDPVDELMLYQTLAGAWPVQDEEARDFPQRVWQWWQKALREAKRHTRWTAPDATYEDACRTFLDAILDAQRAPEFCADLADYVDTIAAAGALNALTQTFLRLTTPGVPDLYQGCDFWDFSLVDPDNRRPVDYAPRVAALAAGAPLGDALAHWRDGEVKQQLIARVLAHRAGHVAFHAEASYQPAVVCGERAGHAIAFERRSASARLLCIATRWPVSLAGSALERPLVPPKRWGDTRVEFAEPAAFVDVLHGGDVAAPGEAIRLADALARFPVAMLFAAQAGKAG